MRIATWNVNSLKIRLPQVLDWLMQYNPDVLALQETKLTDENFPLKDFEAINYHAIYSGQKTFNGVAILSKNPMTDIIKDFPTYNDPLKRVLAATINDIRVINLYVPNGQSIPSDKYTYKLEWLKHLKDFLTDELKQHKKIVVLGDFNIAPEDIDVHDPKAWEGQVLVSELERKAFKEMLALGFKDCFRVFSQEKEFTWWDYRLNAFKRNLGLRIDHILASEALSTSCKKCYIDKNPRTHERPSDHTIIVAEF